MMNKIIEEVNERLKEILSSYRPGLVKEAMIYSVMAGGKRLRSEEHTSNSSHW